MDKNITLKINGEIADIKKLLRGAGIDTKQFKIDCSLKMNKEQYDNICKSKLFDDEIKINKLVVRHV